MASSHHALCLWITGQARRNYEWLEGSGLTWTWRVTCCSRVMGTGTWTIRSTTYVGRGWGSVAGAPRMAPPIPNPDNSGALRVCPCCNLDGGVKMAINKHSPTAFRGPGPTHFVMDWTCTGPLWSHAHPHHGLWASYCLFRSTLGSLRAPNEGPRMTAHRVQN